MKAVGQREGLGQIGGGKKGSVKSWWDWVCAGDWGVQLRTIRRFGGGQLMSCLGLHIKKKRRRGINYPYSAKVVKGYDGDSRVGNPRFRGLRSVGKRTK